MGQALKMFTSKGAAILDKLLNTFFCNEATISFFNLSLTFYLAEKDLPDHEVPMEEFFKMLTPTQRKVFQLLSNHKIVYFYDNTDTMNICGLPNCMWMTKRFLKITAEDTRDNHPYLPKPPRDLPLALTSPLPYNTTAQQASTTGATKDLPSELLVLIFSYVSLRELVNASLVCKHWRSVSHDNYLWRLQFLRKNESQSFFRLAANLLYQIGRISSYSLENILYSSK